MGKYSVKVVNCSLLNVRAGVGTSHKIVSVVKVGDTFTSSKQSDGWYYIDEKKGWSSGKYIKVLKDLNPPPTPASQKQQSQKTSSSKSTVDYSKVSEQLGSSSSSSNISEVEGKRYVGKSNSDVDKLGALNTNPANFSQSYELKYDHLEDNMDVIRRNMNMVGEFGYRDVIRSHFRKFNRFKVPFVDGQLTKTFSHVFFTRPSLNLLDSSGKNLNSQFANDPLYFFLFNNNKELILSLTDHFSKSHDFHPYLSNTANSFELSDEFIKTVEHGETLTGYKVQYGKNNIESNSSGSFSISYIDDAEFNIYKTHKAWIEYISRVYRGEVTPKRDYIQKKILDYTVSVYYFICGPDGETILFWSKYFGVFPTNTPSSASSWSKGSSVKLPEFTINYAYAMKEDFSPLSLIEFNKNSDKFGHYKYRKTYEEELLTTGKTFSNAPFVELAKDKRTGEYVYKLRFRV